MSQLAFDLDELTRPEYVGAPLHWTTDAHGWDELDAAFAEYRRRFGHFGILVGPPHLWHPGHTSTDVGTPGHEVRLYSADLGCDDYDHRPRFQQGKVCLCVGGHVYRAVCECRWVSPIGRAEAETVVAWHDHAWPGWRELPVVPESVERRDEKGRPTKALLAWVEANVPEEWQRPGAPLVSERESLATRCVPGYSPWGGWDIAAVHR